MPTPISNEIAYTFDLEHAVVVNGQSYTQLSARRPKVKDLRILSMGADNDPVGAYNKFLASILTVPPAVIEELDLGTDSKTVQEWASAFLPKGQDGLR